MNVKAKTMTLQKPPILETIFEMRWALPQVPNTQVRRDPAYPLLYGRLYDRFKKEYTVAEDLPSVQMHPDSSPYMVRHRLRKADVPYPLVQVGPGVISVHDGKGYSWERFRDEVVRIFEAFTDFYPASVFPLNIVKTELRFVNGIEMQVEEPVLPFLESKLHTKINLDPGLFATKQVQPQAEGVNLMTSFKLEQPIGNAMLGLGTGMVEEKPAMIQQMIFHSLSESAPQDLGSLDPWLDAMHQIAKQWFETLYRGELLKKFT